MAKIKLKEGFIALSGSLSKSDSYYFMTRYGKTFICRKGHRQSAPSLAEMENRHCFRMAIQFAKQVNADLNQRAFYHKLWKTQKQHYPTFRGWLMHYYFTHYRL